MNTIDGFDFRGKKALVRVDFNVPLNAQMEVTDDTRMRESLPTLLKITNEGGKAIIMSHLGRPKAREEKYSLRHLVGHLEKISGKRVVFSEDCIGEPAISAIAQADNGDMVLLENTRYYAEETDGNESFAAKLAALGDVWVNDAFGTAHRAHASTAVMAKYFKTRMFGYLMEAEIQGLERALRSEEQPFTAIVGGAKVSDKVLVIERLMDRAQHILIGGAMAYTFIAAGGGQVGNSKIEADKMDLARVLMDKAVKNGVELVLPSDSKIADGFGNDAASQVAASDQIPSGWMGLDIGPKAIQVYSNIIKKSKVVIWNGPMGVFEFKNFSQGTQAIAEACAEVGRLSGGYTLVGGGDSVAAINTFGLAHKIGYVSTGGGAMLEYLEGKVLPGIAALAD
jgi:phosphoglycerate kinase